MTIPTRKRTIEVGTRRQPSAEFAVGKNVQVVGVRLLGTTASTQWRQKGRVVQLRTPLHGQVEVEFNLMAPVLVAAAYPLRRV